MTVTITTRTAKGGPLTNDEQDANLTAFKTAIEALQDGFAYEPVINSTVMGTTWTLEIDGVEFTHAIPSAAQTPAAVTPITTTTLTLGTTHAGKYLRFTNASGCAVTIPPYSSVGIPIGSEIEFIQVGAGALTWVAGGGVTLNKRPAIASGTTEQFQRVKAKKVATDEWDIS